MRTGIIVRPAISTLWPINRDGEELVAYDYFCSYHEDSPQNHCAICSAVNVIRAQHRLALEQNKKYLEIKTRLTNDGKAG